MAKMKKKIYFLKFKEYRKFKTVELSYLFYKTLVISIICDKCGSKHKKYLKKKNQLKY